MLDANKVSSTVYIIHRQPPSPLKEGERVKSFRYKGRGAQNRKNLSRKIKKNKIKLSASKKGVRKIFVKPTYGVYGNLWRQNKNEQ